MIISQPGTIGRSRPISPPTRRIVPTITRMILHDQRASDSAVVQSGVHASPNLGTQTLRVLTDYVVFQFPE